MGKLFTTFWCVFFLLLGGLLLLPDRERQDAYQFTFEVENVENDLGDSKEKKGIKKKSAGIKTSASSSASATSIRHYCYHFFLLV
jgi:hypothetical protein